MRNSILICLAACYICVGPKGLVRKNTFESAVATSTVKRGFVTPKFLGLVRQRASVQWLWGMVGATRKGVRMADSMFLTTMLHPMRVRTQKVVPLSQSGAKTMTAITTAIRATTPAPQGTTDLVKLHAEAHNSLAMALHYLRQPQANTIAARRKAVQALAALRGLSLALEG